MQGQSTEIQSTNATQYINNKNENMNFLSIEQKDEANFNNKKVLFSSIKFMSTRSHML